MLGTFAMPKNVPANYHYIKVNLNSSDFEKSEKRIPMLVNEQNSKHRLPLLVKLKKYFYMNRAEASFLSHPTVEQLKAGSQFDLVVFDYFINDYNVGIGAHFQCPTIVISNLAIDLPTRNLVGNPSAAAFTKSLHIDGPLKMNFKQRVLNHVAVATEQLFLSAFDYWQNQANYEQHFPAHMGYPSYHDAKRNISMVLVCSHFVQSGPVLSFPTIREVGGFHIPRVVNPLPVDLQKWFDASDDDVIYMSFGSSVNNTYLSPEKVDAFLTAFQRLAGARVLLKWDADELPGRPESVRIGQWFPQADVLAHPKVKLFISHCGLGGISEARYHGVPVLGIPLFADQFDNLERIVDEGWAKELRLIAVTEQTLYETLKEMLHNEEYMRNAKKASELFRDRPVHPLDEAVFWVQYVLRHSGAKHMQSQAMDLNWLQYHSLDVFAFLIGVAFVIWKCLKWTVTRIIVRRVKIKLA